MSRSDASGAGPAGAGGTGRAGSERVVVLDAETAAELRSKQAEEAAAAAEPVVPETPGYLAIQLGTTRLAAAVVDLAGEVVVRDRVATPARNVWPALTQLVGRVVAANPTDVTPTVCGVTCPGPIDRGTGSMKPVGMPMWHDFPLRRELASVTGLPVAIETPGRALALAEMWCGELAARPPDECNFATLALGDDVDGAFVVGGRLAEGLTGNLGQFGHLVVEPDGAACACGAVGCLTVYAGSRGIEASTSRELRRTPPAIVERTGIMVARACASLAALLDVTDIVLGGVVPSTFGEPFFEAVAREFEQRSALMHLAGLRVRGVGTARIGPLVAAAAVARHHSHEAAHPAGSATGTRASGQLEAATGAAATAQ